MKINEAQTAWLNGAPLLVLTYHSVKAEEIKYRDKTTRLTASFNSIRHTCFTETGAVVWNERVPNEMDVSKYVTPYKRGQKIVVTVATMQNQQGVVAISGTGQVLDEKQ